MAKRQLKGGWLPAFMEWTLPRSEAPESMIRWSGLFSLAATMKRKVYWPKELLGSYSIYPNLYVVFVGEPAVVRKSTTIGYAEDVLSSIASLLPTDPITFAGDVTSHSKLLSALADSIDSSIAVVSSEFSSLVQTTPEAMYEILTDIFDNKPKFEWSTWAHGDKRIEKPVVNLAAATTPAWISKQPPEYFVGGGFASRILFIFEEKPRQKEIYYDHLDHKKLERLGESIRQDLAHIAGLKGAFRHDSNKTYEYIRNWYKTHENKNDDSRLKGYYGRKHVHAHKVAGLLSLSERDDLKITRKHWDDAVSLLEEVESKMTRAFSTLGSNPITMMMDGIIEYIRWKGDEVTLPQIAGRFYKEGWTLDQLKSALTYLCTTGKIKATGTLDPKYRHVD